MYEYFVCLIQIVEAGGNCFHHEGMTRAKKTYEVEKAREQ